MSICRLTCLTNGIEDRLKNRDHYPFDRTIKTRDEQCESAIVQQRVKSCDGDYFQRNCRNLCCESKVSSRTWKMMVAPNDFTSCGSNMWCYQGTCQVKNLRLLEETPDYESYYGPWSGWTTCSEFCGGGTKSRTRTCNMIWLNNCQGPSSETKSCNTHRCPIAQWSEWQDISVCTKSCGIGFKDQTRTCQRERYQSVDACGPASDSRRHVKCNEQPCDAQWRIFVKALT